MTTFAPNAADILTHADGWWRDCAERAALALAETGQPFTADDLTDLGVPDPDVPARWGSLFAALKKTGRIIPVGYRAATRPTRNGGVLRVWTGAAA